MNNKVYLKYKPEDTEHRHPYTDIGVTLKGFNSYRLWINMYVLKDEGGEYISFPIKDAVIEQGQKRSTLKLCTRRGYNVYNLMIEDGSSYRLDTEHTSWKYYDQMNEGLLVVASTAEVNIYFEDKDNQSNRGNIKTNLYGFNELELITKKGGEDNNELKPIQVVIKEALIEILEGGR